MEKTYSRKKYLINPRFQLLVVFWCLCLFLSILTIFAAANWYFFEELHSVARTAGISEEHVFFEFVNEQKAIMLKLFIAASFFSFWVIFSGGIYLSHRIAGPLYRLTQHLLNAGPLDLEKVKFRKGDYFKELEDAYNKFVEKMNEKPK